MSRCLPALASAALALLTGSGSASAAPVIVPNASFETPATGYVSINIDNWQKSPKPSWYVEAGGFLWTQLTGLFKNTLPTSSDHIDNCDGAQAIWLFVVPEVGLFQDYDSVDWKNSTHAFTSTFEVGKAYKLTVGVIGSGGGMLPGASMEISLYYRDSGGNKIKVAVTPIIYTEEQFPNNTHLVDCTVELPVVKPGDPWAGKHIGIQFLSTIARLPTGDPDNLEGGYWDFDNVRLNAEPDPALQATRQGASLRLSWLGASGYQYQVKISDGLSSWTNYGTPLLGSGAELVQLYPLAGHDKAFFRVVVSPAP